MNDIISGRSNSSPIWAYFDVVDKEQAKCKICGKPVKRAGGTTNIRNHLKNNHFTSFYEMENKKPSHSNNESENLNVLDEGISPDACSDRPLLSPSAPNSPFNPLALPSSHHDSTGRYSPTSPLSQASVSCTRESA